MNYLTKTVQIAVLQISADQAKKFSRVNLLLLNQVIIDSVEKLSINVMPVDKMVGVRTHTDMNESINIIEVTFIPDASIGVDVMIQFRQTVNKTEAFDKKYEAQLKRDAIVKVEEEEAQKDPIGTIVAFAKECPRIPSKYPKLVAGYITDHHSDGDYSVKITHSRATVGKPWTPLLPAAYEDIYVRPECYRKATIL